jgi:hypothetical protein
MSVYMTGYAGATMTREQLLSWSVWLRFEPEFRRRLLALMDECIAAGKNIGVGGGWRSSAAQRNLFLSRYIVEDDSDYTGDVFWEGKFWERKPGVANAAPPGLSYHEPCTPEGFCLAVDMIGDVLFADKFAAKHGLRHFGDINGEPWHLQPSEIPNSRRNFKSDMVPLHIFGGTPVPPTPKPPKPIIIVPAPTLKLVKPINMTGPEVAKLQQVMQFWGWYPKTSKCDGWFGPITHDAVVRMQFALKIVADGIYGPITAAKYKAFAEYMTSVPS